MANKQITDLTAGTPVAADLLEFQVAAGGAGSSKKATAGALAGLVTSGQIATALGYTPADAADVPTVPGGSDTQVQFNDGGAFGGDAGFTYDKATTQLALGTDTYYAGYVVAPTFHVEKTYTEFHDLDFVQAFNLLATLDRSSADDYVAAFYLLDAEFVITGTKDYDEAYGCFSSSSHAGSGTVGVMFGLNGAVQSVGGGTVTLLNGVEALAEVFGAGSTVGTLAAYNARIGCGVGGTLGSASGLKINRPIDSTSERGGTLTTLYGVNIDDLSSLAPSVGYAIYSAWNAPSVLSGTLQSGLASTTTGGIKLGHASSAFLTTIQAGNAAAARTYTWPTNFGSAGSVLTDAAGNGTLSWAVPTAGATLGANTFTALQTITQASANAGILASTGYSLTGSDATSMVNLAGTWNTSGNPIAFKLAITNTASGATSKFVSLLAGASGTTEVFSISKAGAVIADVVNSTSGYGIGSSAPTTLGIFGSGSALVIRGTNVLIQGGTGSVILGSAAIATTATDGFLYIPTCAGTPTGVPTAATGRVALVYDTTNKQFWIYDGAWLQPKTPAGAALVTWQ